MTLWNSSRQYVRPIWPLETKSNLESSRRKSGTRETFNGSGWKYCDVLRPNFHSRLGHEICGRVHSKRIQTSSRLYRTTRNYYVRRRVYGLPQWNARKTQHRRKVVYMGCGVQIEVQSAQERRRVLSRLEHVVVRTKKRQKSGRIGF